jgi:hypothetical protein
MSVIWKSSDHLSLLSTAVLINARFGLNKNPIMHAFDDKIIARLTTLAPTLHLDDLYLLNHIVHSMKLYKKRQGKMSLKNYRVTGFLNVLIPALSNLLLNNEEELKEKAKGGDIQYQLVFIFSGLSWVRYAEEPEAIKVIMEAISGVSEGFEGMSTRLLTTYMFASLRYMQRF